MRGWVNPIISEKLKEAYKGKTIVNVEFGEDYDFDDDKFLTIYFDDETQIRITIGYDEAQDEKTFKINNIFLFEKLK